MSEESHGGGIREKSRTTASIERMTELIGTASARPTAGVADVIRRLFLIYIKGDIMSEPVKNWSAQVEELAQTQLSKCYQCGKCTAGCPRADVMDLPPTRIMRAVQTGDILQAATAVSIWRCLSCLTCSARCPKNVEVAGVMDALRQISIENGCTNVEARKIVGFQKAFLRNIRRNGRTNETEMAVDFEARYTLSTFDVANVVRTGLLGPKMIARNKMHFNIGSPVKDKALVRRIFDKCKVEL